MVWLQIQRLQTPVCRYDDVVVKYDKNLLGLPSDKKECLVDLKHWDGSCRTRPTISQNHFEPGQDFLMEVEDPYSHYQLFGTKDKMLSFTYVSPVYVRNVLVQLETRIRVRINVRSGEVLIRLKTLAIQYQNELDPNT